mgnify:CR=1 FL=1
MSDLDASNTAVILCDLGNPQLGRVAKWAARAKLAVHVHVLEVVVPVQDGHFNNPLGQAR